jgi:hypothetical protein
MSGAELGRRRRCRVLQLAMAIGILLPIFQPTWITLASALVGIAVLIIVYRRECGGDVEDDSAQ